MSVLIPVKNKPSCIIKAIENPSLNGILIGLHLSWQKVEVDKGFFPCCSGQGSRELTNPATADSHLPLLGHCQLIQRRKRVERLLERYQKIWPQATKLPHNLSQARSAALLRKLSDVIKGYQSQCHISYTSRSEPSLLWSLAFACTWRFGIQSHVINFSQDPVDLIPPADTQQQTHALFVEKIDRLWDPRRAEALEALITYAYNANAYIWLELSQPAPGTSPRPNVRSYSGARAAFETLAQMREKPPLDFLDDDARSKLASLCHSPRPFHLGVDL